MAAIKSLYKPGQRRLCFRLLRPYHPPCGFAGLPRLPLCSDLLLWMKYQAKRQFWTAGILTNAYDRTNSSHDL